MKKSGQFLVYGSSVFSECAAHYGIPYCL